MSLHPSRRTFLAGVGTLTVGLAGCASLGPTDGPRDVPTADETTTTEPAPDDGDDDTTTPAPAEAVRLQPLATGFASPVAVEFDPQGRMLVADQPGQVYVRDDGGLRRAPVLDLTDRMVDLRGSYDERGLLGLALHPTFADTGRLFVRYSAPLRSGMPSGYSHTFVLSEFRADPDALTVDSGSERVLLETAQPQANHNAGAVAFGPDGYCYVGVGDGGGANDRGQGHVDDWYDAVAGGNGQDTTANLLGSVLRLDVDAAGADGYAIPPDNPLVGRDGRDEQYAWGFRNPWRFSFDGSDLYVADVGQGAWEEVSLVRAGGNYGWNVREGAHCFAAEDCPTEAPDGPLVDPVIEYPHGGRDVSGVSVIGGYVYRGDDIPGLTGTYVFADWQADGRLFVARPSDAGLWPVGTLPIANASDERVGSSVLSFGRDSDDELYVATTGSRGPSGESGTVHRIRTA